MGENLATRTIDNKMLSLSLPDSLTNDPAENFTGHVRWMPRHTGRSSSAERWAFEIAPATALQAGAEMVGGVERMRFKQAGAELVIFDCPSIPNARWAAWVGPWHMAHGMFYAPLNEPTHIAELFSRARWTDTPEGLRGDAGRGFTLDRAVYMTSVPQIGTLFCENRERVAGRVPRWGGKRIKAGEMWRVPRTEAQESDRLMLATSSTVITLSPWDVPPPRASKRSAGQNGAAQSGGTPDGLLHRFSAESTTDRLARAAQFLAEMPKAQWT